MHYGPVKKLNNSLKHRIEYALARLFVAWLRILPRPMAYRFGDAMAWLLGSALKLRRRVIDENRAIAFGQTMSREQRDQIARDCYHHFAAVLVDAARCWRRPIESWTERVETINGLDTIEGVSGPDDPKPVIITGHYGFWELVTLGVILSGWRMCVVAKPIHNPLIQKMVIQLREHERFRVVYTNEPMKTLVRAHREGWFLGFAGDQDARKKGVFFDFFGRPASTALGAAYFAWKMKVPLAPLFVTRLKNGKYRVEREELIPIPEGLDKDAAVEEMTRQHMARLEKRIREHPEQYWWFHRRWKTRPKQEATKTAKGDET